MRVQINHTTLELVEGDITELDTDTIVNAANERLAHGGAAGVISRNFQYPQTGSAFAKTPPASRRRFIVIQELGTVKSTRRAL